MEMGLWSFDGELATTPCLSLARAEQLTWLWGPAQQRQSCKALPVTSWTEAEGTSHLPSHPPEMSLAFKCTGSLK